MSILPMFLLPPLGYALSLLWGALWGSFANVCIYRIPLSKSILAPRSACPSCHRPIAAYDNIPLLSFFLLRGRCRSCQAPISWRYPTTELAIMLISLGLFSRFFVHGEESSLVNLAAYLIAFFFSLTLVVLSMIDWEHKILPDVITYPAIAVFFGLGRIVAWCTLVDACLSLIGGYLFVRFLSDAYYYITKREGLGYGDGKLLALIGGLLGWKCLLTTLLFGSILGTSIGIPMLLFKKRNLPEAQIPLRQMALPFGPFLSLGAIISLFLFAGRDIGNVIFGLMGSWFL